jgi:MFS family permease
MGLAADERNPFLYYSLEIEAPVKRFRARWGGPFLAPVGADETAAAIGFVTFIFGLGQISGPAVAGVLAEKTGSFTSSYYMAAAFAGVAILLAVFLRKPETDPAGDQRA